MSTTTEWAVMTPERERRGYSPVIGWADEEEAREFVAAHPRCVLLKRTVTYGEWTPDAEPSVPWPGDPEE